MTPEDASAVNGAKARAIDAYDQAVARSRDAHIKVERSREAVAKAGKAAEKQGSWPTSARAMTWPSSDEVLAGIEELRQASDAVNTARQDLRNLGLRPEIWPG